MEAELEEELRHHEAFETERQLAGGLGPEEAIRRALGAPSAIVVRAVVRSGLVLTVAGLALGALGAIAMARALSGMLFQVDLRVLFGSGGVLAVSALIACALRLRAPRVWTRFP